MRNPLKNTEPKRKRMLKGHRKPKDWEEIKAIERLVKRKHRGTAKGRKFMSLGEREDYNKIARILN